MLSNNRIPFHALWLGAAIAVLPVAPAYAQIAFTPQAANSDPEGSVVCTFLGTVYLSGDSGACDGSGSSDPTTLTVGGSGVNSTVIDSLGATFNGFNSFTKSAQFSGNQAFSGMSAFNSTVTFTGPSVTFSTGTTFSNPATFNGTAAFNSAITTNGITNTGTISSGTLSGTTVNATTLNAFGSLNVSNGATVNLGGNVVHGVAAGVADTDAVNVAQLNAATSGITADVTALETDVTALETTTATHTTQITSLQSTTATHTTQITNLETGLAATNDDLAAETAARVAADTALDGRVDALEAITANLDERFDDAADRADAGTATAIALSGAMFLPGKSFNLTANVGAYRGAVAAALQFGALVSDNAAINAGFAKGFSKGGKAAVRAGFTLGW